jgi:hypothetical protein
MDSAVAEVTTKVNEGWTVVQFVFAFLGFGGLTIGTAALAAWALFKKWGEEWLSIRFQKNLEEAKAEQAREMERLRHRINSTFDRISKLNTREFETLPEIWGYLVDANGWASDYTNLVQSFPNILFMDDDQMREMLDGTTFTATQKRDIMAVTDKDRLDKFIEIRELHWYAETMQKLRDFNQHFRKNSIFVHRDLKAKIDEMFELIRKAIIEHHVNETEDIRPVFATSSTPTAATGQRSLASWKKWLRADSGTQRPSNSDLWACNCGSGRGLNQIPRCPALHRLIP